MNTTTSFTETSPVDETPDYFSPIDYTPDAIDEYIVIVNLPEDWETVHNYIINENDIDGIPNRKINCSNIREFSLRTSIYEMSSAEADILKTHEKVESVGLNPEKYPQPQQLFAVANRFGQVVAFPKPLVTSNQGSYSDQSFTNNIRSNWAMLCADNPSSEPFQGVGITTVRTVDRDLTYTRTGTGVDAVIIDSGMSVLHPEFIAPDGSYRVRDIILDGPYKVDPAAFSGYTTTVTIDGVNIGTRAEEARARLWWSDTTIRSSAFQSLGTLSITSNYTRIHAHSENGTNNIIDGHGTACAGQIGGKSFGHAFECNLWNVRIALSGSGGFLDPETALDACTIFHNAKKAISSDPDPTLINNSYGSDAQTGNSSGVSYTVGFRGSTTSYTGSGSNGVPPSNAGSFRNNKYFRWMDSGGSISNTPGGSGTGEYLVATTPSGVPYSNIAATNSSAEDAIAAGCIVVASAGNNNQKLSDKTDVDFNNWYNNANNYVNRVANIQQGFSGDHDVDKGSIRVGAIDCAVEPYDELQGATKYSLRKVCYSNNGPMVDIFAGADESMTAGYANYKSYQRVDNSSYYDYYFGGTSSAGPNVCSVIALYLQSSRGANQSAVRQWLKTTASKSNLISDPYPNINGTYYFVSPYVGNQYDDPTRPSESYNFRGCGNLRGAPNRILFNPFTTEESSSQRTKVSGSGLSISGNITIS